MYLLHNQEQFGQFFSQIINNKHSRLKRWMDSDKNQHSNPQKVIFIPSNQLNGRIYSIFNINVVAYINFYFYMFVFHSVAVLLTRSTYFLFIMSLLNSFYTSYLFFRFLITFQHWIYSDCVINFPTRFRCGQYLLNFFLFMWHSSFTIIIIVETIKNDEVSWKFPSFPVSSEY